LPRFHCWENEAVHSGVEQEEHLPRFHCLDNEAPHSDVEKEEEQNHFAAAVADAVVADLTKLHLPLEAAHSGVEEEEQQQQPNWKHFAAAVAVVVAVELLGRSVGETLEQLRAHFVAFARWVEWIAQPAAAATFGCRRSVADWSTWVVLGLCCWVLLLGTFGHTIAVNAGVDWRTFHSYYFPRSVFLPGTVDFDESVATDRKTYCLECRPER